MQTNLIQNYIINNRGTNSEKNVPQTPLQYDFNNYFNNRTFIKPLPPKGKLVKNNITYMPANFVRSIGYDIKSFKNAIKGNANDHELGKLNDAGMKLGGLAIAYYLFNQKHTPLTKSMEFIGLVSFFASMLLWKKLAIQLPARIINGVNIDRQYEDSFGRRKPFYLDPQFLPWDLYSDKQINKIGDRMGVPRNIQNRRDFIQEKMKKIAVQNNTLWMLTAGFATPVMSSLICDAVKKPLGKYLDTRRNREADKLADNHEARYGQFIDKYYLKNTDKIINEYKDTPLDERTIKALSTAITEDIDPVTAKAIEEDLLSEFNKQEYTVAEKTREELLNNIKKALSKSLPSEAVETITPSQEQIQTVLKKLNIEGNTISDNDFSKLLKIIQIPLEDNLENYNKSSGKKIDFNVIQKILIKPDDEHNPIIKALKSNSLNTFDTEKINTVKSLREIFADFNAKIALWDKYAYLKAGMAEDTVIAKYWADATDTLIKILKLTPKDIENTRYDRELTADLVQRQLEKICSNKTEYEKAVNEVIQKISHLDTLIKPSDITDVYNKQVESIFEDTAVKLHKLGLDKTVEALVGKTVEADGKTVRNLTGSLLNIQLSYVSKRIESVKNSFIRFLCCMDYNRRIASKENIPALHKGIRREVKEAIVELGKIITLKGHASDFATKFYFKRNPFPEADYSDIEVKDGKVINKYLGKTGNRCVDIPQNAEFFDETMKLMFDNPLHSETASAAKSYTLLDEINNYRKNIIEHIGQDEYFAKERHLVWGLKKESTSEKRANLLGAAPDEMIFKKTKQMFNSRKWLKMFGGFGIGLFGITVLAQFFLNQQKGGQTK